MSAGSVALVVPVFDEAARFAEYGKLLVDWIAEQPAGSELVFVDDGSTDGTPTLVRELIDAHRDVAVRLVARPHEGKGAAVSAGLASANAPIVAFCDLDLSTPLDQLELVIDAARRAPVLAIGSRDLAASRLLRPEGRVREALGRTYNRLLQATITPGIVDTQCGAKAARVDLWRAVLDHTREPGYAWDAEAVAVALALGIAVQEVAIDWRHDDRSKVNVLRDGARMVAATPRIRRRARAAGASRRDTVARSDLPASAVLAAADPAHWWFRSKAAYVATALRRTAAAREPGVLVDLGAGTGSVTRYLGWRPDRIVVCDRDASVAALAAGRHGFAAAVADAATPPLQRGSADVVCLLDVLEHLDDPAGALRAAAALVAPDGRVVLTVPAHPWLWSAVDERLDHRRRYTRRAVRSLVRDAGLEPVVLTHVFSWLVAPVLVARRILGKPDLGIERRGRLADLVALVLTGAERRLVGRLPLPLGSSIVCVARHPRRF